MKNTKPNIIFVVLDALRFDRMGSSGYKPALTPNLDRLAEEGINCTSNYAVGCPTQMAMPGIFSSSLPFDYGGYTTGIRSRPFSFVELLQNSGYETFGVTTVSHTSSHCGYGRGFDDYVNMFTILSWLQTVYATKLSEPLQEWEKGIRTNKSISDFLSTSYADDLKNSMLILDEHRSRNICHRSTNYDEISSRLTAELDLLRREPLNIAHKLVSLGSNFPKALGDQTVSPNFVSQIGRSDQFRKRLNRKLFINDERRFYSARQVNETVRQFFKSRPQVPYFLYVHYFDIHDAKLLFSAATWRRLMELPLDLVNAAKGRQNFHLGGLFYDIALSYTDRHFGQFVSMVESNEIEANTIFIITADHGLPTQHPIRNNTNDLSTFFYEDWLRVPLIVHGPGIDSEEISVLMSHLDIGPTILSLAKIENPVEFRGRDLSYRSTQPEPYVFAENCGRGRCELDTKTFYIGVHNKNIKIVYQVENFQPQEKEVFDLTTDPDEQHNLRDTNKMTEARQECEQLVIARINELRG